MRHAMAAAAALVSLAGAAGAQSTFELHSGFWVNLHQFLLHEKD